MQKVIVYATEVSLIQQVVLTSCVKWDHLKQNTALIRALTAPRGHTGHQTLSPRRITALRVQKIRLCLCPQMVCVCATEDLCGEIIHATNVLQGRTTQTKALSIHVLCTHILMLSHGGLHSVLVCLAFTVGMETAASALWTSSVQVGRRNSAQQTALRWATPAAYKALIASVFLDFISTQMANACRAREGVSALVISSSHVQATPLLLHWRSASLSACVTQVRMHRQK